MSPDEAVQEVEERTSRKIRNARILYGFAILGILVVALLEYQTRQALCTFRGDLEQRVINTQDYLATHQAKTIFGVSRATIVTNLNNQERTLRSLNGLHC